MPPSHRQGTSIVQTRSSEEHTGRSFHGHVELPDHKQADSTRMRDSPSEVQGMCGLCAQQCPKQSDCDFVLAGTHLQSDRQPKGTALEKSILKH